MTRLFTPALLLVLWIASPDALKCDSLFTYTNGVFTTVNVPAIYSSSSFGGINDSGEIVGTYNNGYQLLGLIDSGGAFSTFGYPSASPAYGTTIAQGINDAGQISGSIGPLGPRGFIYLNGAFTVVSAPSAGYAGTNVSGINNNGQVVGDAATFANQYFIFIDSNGSFTTIPVSSGFPSPNAINDADQIVGASSITGNSFEYSNGAFTTIAFPGATTTTATGINDAGEIVGSFTAADGTSHGFLDSNGVFTQLDFPSARDTHLTGVNDLGEVVGTYTLIPEPCSFLLAALGIAAAAGSIYKSRA